MTQAQTRNHTTLRTAMTALGVVMAAALQATVLTVEVGPKTRATEEVATEAAVRQFARNLDILTQASRDAHARWGKKPALLSMPVSVIKTRNGQPVPPPVSSRGSNDITLVFNTASGRSFPTDYRDFLVDLYTKVKPRLDATFGDPSVGGNVLVSNYDADIGDRDAVAGGYYTYDGTTQEIRFPVYSDSLGYKAEVAAVNFLHTLLLAYIGPRSLPGDGWQEGLVRAAVAQIVRTPGAMPSTLDANALEGILESTYEVGPAYDWHNQKALSCNRFIAPNLASEPLPVGGSRGGLYLLRYQMAGSAMQKVLVEYPGFAKEFLQLYYPQANITSTGALASIAQTAINLVGGPSSTIEGLTFAQWARRQRILAITNQPGPKIALQAFPITSDLQGSEFGVFGIEMHSFRTNLDGTETLLGGTSFPIFFSPDYTRFFTSGQEDKVTLYLGYGSIVPNFPGTAFDQQPYRVAVDVPIGDQVQRAYFPAGAVATATNPTPSTVYGSVTGLTSGTYSVKISWAGNEVTLPVTNGAFGDDVTLGNFLLAQRRVQFQVLRTPAGEGPQVVLTRLVNKGPGALAVDLHIGADQTLSLGQNLTAGIQMTGFVGEPYENMIEEIFAETALGARWNPIKSRFDRYPEFSAPTQGQGFFWRTRAPRPIQYEGFLTSEEPLSVALRPGWNLVVNPHDDQISLNKISVITGTDFVRSFADAVATNLVGQDLFTFLPGAADAGSGVSETGSLLSTSILAPGQAFYVKCLSSEGATLLIDPDAPGTASRSGAEGSRWEIGVKVSGGAELADAKIGGRTTSKLGLDAADTELPPTMGGLQLAVGPSRFFRDTRGYGKAEMFRVKLENAKIGTKYTLDLQFLMGKTPSANVVVVGGPRKRLTKTGSLTFTARKSTHEILITVPRVAR